ncbi:MAG: hypothetical protein AAFO69_13450 [Bacteroidota bacterium]
MDLSTTNHLFLWYDHRLDKYAVGAFDDFVCLQKQYGRTDLLVKFDADAMTVATAAVHQLNNNFG